LLLSRLLWHDRRNKDLFESRQGLLDTVYFDLLLGVQPRLMTVAVLLMAQVIGMCFWERCGK